MKQYFILLSTLFCMDCCSQGVKNNQKDSARSNEDNFIIREIRKKVGSINSDSSKQKITIEDIGGESAEGGEIKKYYLNKKLCKAIATFYGETGKSIREFYFWDEALLFLYQREEQYNEPIYNKNSKSNKIEENRFYFSHGKLVRWVRGAKIMDKALYSSKESEILGDLKEFFGNVLIYN